jgi:hypothetical protein
MDPCIAPKIQMANLTQRDLCEMKWISELYLLMESCLTSAAAFATSETKEK